MKVPFVDLGWQHSQIAEPLQARLTSIMESSAFVSGPALQEFEANFAKYLGVGYCIGVGSGTDALTISLNMLNLPPGSEVITIPNTFFATAAAIMHAGLKPVFADIDPKTRNFNFDALRAAITPNTKVIIPVHLYGAPADIDQVLAVAKEHNLAVIEDACQAHGALYKGKRVGSLGTLSAFSFYPGKNLGAYGQGGLIATNDEALAQTARKYRNQGCLTKYDHEVLGYNSRLDTMQAAVLDEKLKLLDGWNEMRRTVAAQYRKSLTGLAQIELPPEDGDSTSVYHLFVIRVPAKDRDALLAHLEKEGVGAGIHYPVSLHLTPALQVLGYKKGDFPQAEALAQEMVSLPVFPGMTQEQVEYAAATVRSYFNV